METPLQKISAASKEIDKKFQDVSPTDLLSFKIPFGVPSFHSRYDELKSYDLLVTTLKSESFNEEQLIFADKGLSGLPFLKSILPTQQIFFEEAREETFKEWNWINEFINANKIKETKAKEVVGIGGGLTLNVAAYVAEMLHLPLIQIPTTVIGMADGSGGKVRLNLIDRGRFFKHYYKSFYEPNRILIDPRFLESLSEKQIGVGMGEIIKHGIYQSPDLLKFLLSDTFRPFSDKNSLLKAILWTASLKEVCLRFDVEENANGSRFILRGGHELSDRIEEDSHFQIPHGQAVAMGVYRELELGKSELLASFVEFCEKFSIVFK